MLRIRARAALAVGLAAVASLACEPSAPPFREPLRLGGKLVPAATLEEGRRAYRRHCRTCHGFEGAGDGPTGWSQRPPPRDLRSGTFKFGSVPAGELPTDEDLKRIVTDGLAGTAMVPWDVPGERLDALVQYVKTFSPRWREEAPGEPVVAEEDPWGGRDGEAILRGERLYHALARCQACHPSYLPAAHVEGAARALGVPIPESRADPHAPVATRSDFGPEPLRATDFVADELRSVRAGSRRADLWRVIAAGVGGTAMPTWKGALPDRDLWALARYVESLAAQRGKATAREIAERRAARAER
jgi:mono/diheme cytochrome c family protein